MGLNQGFYKILREYKEVYEEILSTGIYRAPLLVYFNNDLKKIVSTEVEKQRAQLLVDSSTGIGRTTKTPWIAILDERITKKASKGTYIVYLFNKDERTLYLTLEQSITEAKERATNLGIKGKALSKKINQILEEEKKRVLDLISVGKFKTDNRISTGKEDFNITAIAYEKYEMNSLPDDAVLRDDLYQMIEIYSQYYEKCYSSNNENENIQEKHGIELN